tara:strand:- start:8484 stop:9149 length:666 start_codon:yes stop_codon:yes gene_type:complete
MKKKFLFWSFLFILLTTYNYKGTKNFISELFIIKEIEIEGVKNSNKNDLQVKLEKIKTKNIFFLKERDFDNIIFNVDFVNSLKIKKIYPKKIKITVVEDRPIGIFFNDQREKYILLENKKIIKNQNYSFDLPEVQGNGAIDKFSDFYLGLQKTGLNLKLIKSFVYFDIDRWDLLLEDEKLIKLPPENYEESVVRFLEIYEKSNFKKFKVFDFRIKNELIVK